ncbi:MAG: hypothetical protein GXO02_03055, partial [Epsilonproteobacteria bacterium]|nr:hypothetical protein [Campylobacterota bacterium]
EYFIKVKPPKEYFATIKDIDSNSNDSKDSDIDQNSLESNTILLNSNEEYLDLDIGLFKPACLGDKVWEDNNLNGIQDEKDTPIKGAKVELFYSNGEKAVDIFGNLIKPIFSDENGHYKFCNLLPGRSYKVKITPPLSNYFVTKNDIGSNSLDNDIGYDLTSLESITLLSGEEYLDLDGGFFRYASLGDYIWLDTNLNGIQDKDEFAIVGIKIELLDENKKVLATTYTNKKGRYYFTQLLPGKEYQVKIYPPKDYIFTKAFASSFERDSNANSNGLIEGIILSSGENNLTFDAGLYCECIEKDGSLELDEQEDLLPSLDVFNISILVISLIIISAIESKRRRIK